MEKSSTCPNSCVNCGYTFQSENGTRRQNFSFVSNQRSLGGDEDAEMEVQIVDAIFDVFGVAFHDFYPEEEIESVNQTAMARTVSLCCDCTELLTKLYDSFKDLKKASDENSLLWNSVKFKRKQMNSNKREFEDMENFPTDVKQEIVSDEMLMTEDFLDENGVEDFSAAGSVDDGGFFGICDNNSIESIVKQELEQDIFYEGNAKKRNLKTKHRKRRFNKRRTERETEKLKWNVNHLDSLKGVAPIKCCATSFATDAEFIAHVNENHRTESEKPEEVCGICKRKILGKYLDFHMAVLHQGKWMVFKCPVCKKTFASEWHLANHRRKKHPTSRSTLQKLDHTGVKKDGSKAFCDKCQKYFGYNYYIRYHLPVTHKTDDQRYQCDICGRSVKSEEYLKIHTARYHTQSKSKICDICGKTLAHFTALYRHKKIHEADVVTDKEKFKCTHCGICLKHTAGLKKHIRQMHGKASLKVLTCELCGKTTKTMTNMRIHMKVHDPNRSLKSAKQNNPTNPEIAL